MINVEELINQEYLEFSFGSNYFYCTFALSQDDFAVINLTNLYDYSNLQIILDEWNYELIENTILEMIEEILTH